jgi:hypothetical protein
MEIRGERECQNCGARWSYYETGAVECPDCGSMRSVGVDERTLHTATGADLGLTAARAAAADSTREGAAAAAEAARRYVRRRGFVDGGDLQPLDELFVRAHELRTVASELRRALDPGDAVEAHFLALLGGDDPGTPPEALRAPYGLARAAAAGDYCEDVSAWTGSEDGSARRVLEAIRDRRKRVEALDGDVPPEEAAALVAAARTLGAALRGEGPTPADAREALR